MVNKLTLEEVQKRVEKLLPAGVKAKSALTQAGATNISFDTTMLSSVQLGGPGLYTEGQKKALSVIEKATTPVAQAKLVYNLLYSTEADNAAGVEEYKTNLITQAVSGLIKGADIAVLNGTDPATGAPVAVSADINLKDNATQSLVTGTFNETLIAALKATKKKTGAIFSDAGFAELAYTTTAGGTMFYPNVSRNSSFILPGGTDGVYSSALGLNGWTPTEIENNNLVAIGPWDTISRSFKAITVKKATEATIGGFNLFEENYVCYQIEQQIKFSVEDPTAFTVIKSEADPVEDDEEEEG